MIGFEYRNPTKILFGAGKLDNLAKEIMLYGKRVLLVYGGGSIRNNGTYDRIMKQLGDYGITVSELGNVTVPSLENVYRGIEICRKDRVEVVIGIGGGSCIDVAKSIAVGAANDVDIWDVLTGKIPYDGLQALPIGAVVTVAGSGSEMDGNSEIDDMENGIHGSIGSFQKTYPSFSILDPQLTYSVPFEKTAFHGVCIMIQALEQYICNTENTPIQDGFIETICRVVMESLLTLKKDLKDENARGQLLWASALVTNRILGRGKGAPWMAGPLGGLIDEKAGLTYSQGIAITFPKYMLVCYRDTLSVMRSFAVNAMGVNQNHRSCEEIAYEGALRFQQFLDDIGIPHSLKDLGIHMKPSDFEAQIASVAKRGIISEQDLKKIVEMSVGD